MTLLSIHSSDVKGTKGLALEPVVPESLLLQLHKSAPSPCTQQPDDLLPALLGK
jgi:hypothetical protein